MVNSTEIPGFFVVFKRIPIFFMTKFQSNKHKPEDFISPSRQRGSGFQTRLPLRSQQSVILEASQIQAAPPRRLNINLFTMQIESRIKHPRKAKRGPRASTRKSGILSPPWRAALGSTSESATPRLLTAARAGLNRESRSPFVRANSGSFDGADSKVVGGQPRRDRDSGLSVGS